MKKTIGYLCAFALTIFSFQSVYADQFEDDHITLEEMTKESEELFEKYNGLKVFGTYNDEGSKIEFKFSVSDIRQLIKDHKKLDGLWTAAEDEKCLGLNLSSAARGQCIIRSIALSLATFSKDFTITKNLLRSKGEYGIHAATALSTAVKSYTRFTGTNCELAAASAYGGTASGLISSGCLLTATDKAIKYLALVRNIVREPKSGFANNMRIRPRGLSPEAWAKRVQEQRESLKNANKWVTEAIDKYFPVRDEFQKGGNEAAKTALALSNRAFEGFLTNYCTAFKTIILQSFKEDAKNGSRTEMYCQTDLLDKRSTELSKMSYEDFQAPE